MKVFVSWSGPHSKDVAQLLSEWIEDVLQGTKAWISTEDIEKGSVWFSDISTVLKDTSVGILVLTRANVGAPWILFEAGALSKGLTTNRVCPFLVDMVPSDLNPPLSMFNCCLPTKDDMLKLLGTINACNATNRLTNEKLMKSVSKWWKDFESKFKRLNATHKNTTPQAPKSQSQMTSEILDISRLILRNQQWSNFSVFTHELVDKMLLKLTPAEEKVIRMYWGVGTTRHSIEDIAVHFEATPKTITSLRNRAMNKLRRYIKA